MVDALAHCNTTVCDMFLMDKMVAGNDGVKPFEFQTVLMLWTSNKVPTVPVLEKFSKTVIPALERNSDQRMVYHHSLLCFGAMVRRYIHSEEMNKKICVLEVDKMMHQRNIDYSRKYEKVRLYLLVS